MNERATVWIYIAEHRRPGIVIEVCEGDARVAYGTRQERADYEQTMVSPETRQGRAFPLDEVTFFYGSNTEWRPFEELQPGARPCSFDLLYAVRRVVAAYDAKLAKLNE